MRPGRLRWYADRLRAMSAREVLHRMAEVGARRAWRRRPVGWPAPAGDGAFPPLPEIRRGLAAAAGRSDPAFAESSSRAFAGSFRFLGHDWPPYRPGAGDAVWFHDPVRGGRWPGREVPSSMVDVRSTWPADGPVPPGARGDVKYVWECNRLQMLHPLAAALAGGDPRAGPRALAILRDWCACNPPYGGVNWVSGIELALRLVGLALLGAAAGPDGFAPDERALLRTVVAAHARPLAAFPSLHSSANNHRVAEGLGLLVAGVLLGGGHRAWEREGRAILEAEACRQILPDGVGAEQSPTYQAFTMEMLAFGVLLARDAGRPLAPAVTGRLADGAGFLLALMNEAGEVPAIGDDDEGRVLAQPPDREPRYVASVAAAVAGLAGRPDLLPPARSPHWRDDLFAVPALGSAPSAAFEGTGAPRSFPAGGYTVARETIAGRTSVLVFDHGPLGYLSLSAHGHADALALWLDLDGTPVLIDPGTYLYHSGRERRTALRESPAHNTLAVLGRSQSVARPAFSWASRAACTVAERRPGPGWSVTARHDGYRRRFGVLHERCVERDPAGFRIRDRLVGGRALPVEIRFAVDPGLELRVADGAVTALRAGEPLCRFLGPRGFAGNLLERPGLSRRFGEVEDGRGFLFRGVLGAEGAVTAVVVHPRPETGRPVNHVEARPGPPADPSPKIEGGQGPTSPEGRVGASARAGPRRTRVRKRWG